MVVFVMRVTLMVTHTAEGYLVIIEAAGKLFYVDGPNSVSNGWSSSLAERACINSARLSRFVLNLGAALD